MEKRWKCKNIHPEEMSRFFDECYEEGLFMDFEAWEMERAKKLIELFELEPGWSILEPGCGCGRMTRLLAKKIGPVGKIEGCELSQKMVDFCRSQDFISQVNFSNLSVLETNFPPETFDCILCFNVWPHFGCPRPYLEKFHELAKPEGILIIAHSASREDINSIHKQSSNGRVRGQMLPPAEDLAEVLVKFGWIPEEIIDNEEIYLLKAGKVIK